MINTVFVILTWVVGAVATVGPVAVIVGLIFFPAVIVPLISRLAKAFMECVPCIVAVSCVLACLGAYWVGHHAAASDCRAAELRAELRNKQIDLDEANKAKADEASRANTIEAQASDQRKEDLAAIADLKKRPPTCAFDDVDAGSVPDDKSGTGRKKSPAKAR